MAFMILAATNECSNHFVPVGSIVRQQELSRQQLGVESIHSYQLW